MIPIKRFSYHNKYIAQRLSKLPGGVGAGALVVVIGSLGILPGGVGAGALVVVIGSLGILPGGEGAGALVVVVGTKRN